MSNNPGVGGNVISTPKGGGAISGMGEKFSPDLFTGTGNFSVPIALPPGRNGFQPDLTIVYSTGNGNGPFGLGWSLSLPGVSRKTSKGIPLYDESKDVFILSGAEDLIPVPGGANGAQRYRPRTEGLFARIERYKNPVSDCWKVWSKDGLVSYYGTPGKTNTPAQYNDPATCADPEYKSKVYNWMLSRTVDVFGNEILYTYERSNRPSNASAQDPHNWDNIYLSEIKYADYKAGSETRYLASVKFVYEERPDPFSDYKSGFEIRHTKRCTRIEIYTHPDNSSVLTKTYHFLYQDTRVAMNELAANLLPLNGASILSQVKIEGHDGETSEWMPPLEFSYSTFEPKKRDFYPIGGKNLPSASLASSDYELADMFGTGLPDIIQMNGVARYWKNLGNGIYDMPRDMKEAPLGLELADPEVSMMDAQGDGKIDLVVTKQGMAGYFPLRHNGLWDRKSFKKYRQIPSFSLADPEVLLIDLDGDGVTDVMRNGSSLECFMNDPEIGFYKTIKVEKKKIKGFPNVSFADPRIRTVDMSGDGMQDIVMIHDGLVEYWPNMGHGKWGARVAMKNCPRFPYQYDPARILIGDIDGDGVADIVYVENNKVTLWINQHGNAWSDPVVIHGTPPVHSMAAVRIADMIGSGVPGIVWSYEYDGTQRDRMLYFDFTGGIKPYLLNEMNNHMGAVTRVSYASSTQYFLEDNKSPETRWKTSLPFPVLVVAKTEVIDEISEGKLVTEYSYHHGHYDGGEREFRGFGRVEQRDTETFERYNLPSPDFRGGTEGGVNFNKTELTHYTPPMLSKSWFHLGPVGDEFGEWQEVDFSHEYWIEDPSVLTRPQEMLGMIRSLPRRARRDAYRTLRGSMLRSEVYALDKSPRQNRPYTVSENLQGVRLEFSPSDYSGSLGQIAGPEANNKAGSGYIFFSHGLASRTTQWERGEDPMTSFSFVDDYDNYGIPRKQTGIAVPRGKNILGQSTGNSEPYLATYGTSSFIHKEDTEHYLIGRAKSARSYEVVNNGAVSVFKLHEQIISATSASAEGKPVNQNGLTFNLLSHAVTYYDGTAYTGLPYGLIGDYGVPVRTETLMMTDEQVNVIYGSERPPYLIKSETPGTPAWTSDYPSGFRSSLPANAGYHYHAAGSVYEDGYYAIADRKKFDFHTDVSTAKGLVLKMMDPVGDIGTESRTATVTYDSYKMLPVKVTDPLGMETLASYDYRVMQAWQITDPNLNRVQFDFSPLGFVSKSAVMGKTTESKGDTLTDPGSRMEYDFFAWMNDRQPVYVKTIVREHHILDIELVNNNTIESIQYSDGFGRLIQSRAQCEEVIFGDSLFGDSGLPLSQTSNANAVGIENTDAQNINVVVSGWQVYNNKGLVVEKYEPYYDKGFQYSPPLFIGEGPGEGSASIQALARSKKVRMFYDPRGQAIRTLNPDGTEQRVIFGIPLGIDNPNVYTPTPWESYTYDANDLAPVSNVINGSAALSSSPSHYFTPASSLIDPLGRTIKTVDRLTSSMNDATQVVMQYEFDIRGNLLRVTDALGRETFKHKYDLANRPLWTEHIDAGVKTVFMDCMSKPVEMRDAKGALVLNNYDTLNRPLSVWARDKTGESIGKRSMVDYGDTYGIPNPEEFNLKGKPFMVYDEAGLMVMDSYDFKGNLMGKIRHVIDDSSILFPLSGGDWSSIQSFRTNWEAGPQLDLTSFNHVSMEYDALNRITRMVYPEDADGQRKVLLPEYNRAGALTRVKMKDTEAAPDNEASTYVKCIAYNAKGQRILAAFGNGVMTRYRYDENNFRLTRMKTESYINEGHNYEPNGTVHQNLAYVYDLAGNIVSINNKTTNCGYGATPDELTRKFSYDALYRLLSATGREKDSVNDYPFYDNYIPENPTATRGYKQNYTYDKLGNIQSLQHIATGGNFTRNFSYVSKKNKLDKITAGLTDYNFTHDVNGNILSDDGGSSRFYEYDYADRIKTFRIQAGTSEPSRYALYLYDGSGNRVKKLVRTQGGGYRSVVYIDGIFETAKEFAYSDVIPNLEIGTWVINSSQTGVQNILHIMDDQSRIATRRIGDALGDIEDIYVKYNIDDHLGSSAIQLDANGSLINREEYYPFGETSYGSYGKKRYRFCGKEKDEESGLYYYGMRYYSAWTCRFMSMDPLASKYPFYTPYQYAGNHPINFIDLDGLEQGTTSDMSHSNTNSQSRVKSKPSGNKGNETKVESNGSNAPVKTDNANGIIHSSTDSNVDTYEVAADDTVYSIAKKYGDPTLSTEENVELIKQQNNLNGKYHIEKGQILEIPQPSKFVAGSYESTDPMDVQYTPTEVKGESPAPKQDSPKSEPSYATPGGGPIKYFFPNYEEPSWAKDGEGPFESASIVIEGKFKVDETSIEVSKEFKETGDGVFTAKETEVKIKLSAVDAYKVLKGDTKIEATGGIFMKFKIRGNWLDTNMLNGEISYNIFKIKLDSNGNLKIGVEFTTDGKKYIKGFDYKVDVKPTIYKF